MSWFSRRTAQAVVTIAIFLFVTNGLRAQSGGIVDVSGVVDPNAKPPLKPPFWSQTAGEAFVAFQGYYVSGSGQPFAHTSGSAITFKEFLPGIGIFHAAVEGSVGKGFHTGTTFVGLEQVPIFGWHWDFLAGDSQVSSNLLENPFSNIYTPDISTRGFRVAMKRKDRSYQFFVGDDTLLGGPRIAYRLTLPQKVFGATMTQDIGDHLKFAVRFIHLDTNPSVVASQTGLFFPGHIFRTSNSLTFQSSYSFSKHVKLYGELSYGNATSFSAAPTAQKPLSFFVGPSWETDRFSFRANYVSQSASYLPLLGYFSGDRRGSFAEARYRVSPKINVYGSASEYSNNLEHNSQLPTFHSSGISTGASLILPWNLNASASISTLHLTTLDPSNSISISDNRQINLDVSRAIGRHNLRFSYIDMKLNSNSMPQSQRFTEGGDTFTWKRLVIGGAVRFQGSRATDARNTIFFRGSIQANVKRISVYANFEKGSDLINSSVFSTNAYSSTVIGFNVPLHGGWNLQCETFRNNLNTKLNAQNVFLFPTAGLEAAQLPGFGQWSGYFRIGKLFNWGNKESVASGGVERYASARVPLVGSIQGMVMEHSQAGIKPAANVSVILDSTRSALTDASGHYAFSDVPEGFHAVGLDFNQLPSEYESGPGASAHLVMEPRALLRSDFSVLRLTHLTGRITAPADMRVGDVVVRLAGTNRYTTPDGDGNFGFYNLREGKYTVAIDLQTIPEDFILTTPVSLQALASDENEASASTEFRLDPKPQPEKPVRYVLQQEIRVGTSAPAPIPPPSSSGHKSKKTGVRNKR